METECGICCEALSESDQHERLLDCKHDTYFHAECLQEWFEKEKCCPLCRGAIFKPKDLVPYKEISYYPFAIQPETYQPSGHINWTKIYNPTLQIYAVNYNVLKVMSGMGGMMYSN